MDIDDLREAFRIAREAHAEACAAEKEADCARIAAGTTERKAEQALDGSVEAEQAYLAALDADRTTYDAWREANDTKSETEHSLIDAERAYKDALHKAEVPAPEQGQTFVESLKERFTKLAESDHAHAKALLSEFGIDRFSGLKEQDYIVFDKRLTELSSGHRGSSQEIGTTRKPPVVKIRKGRK